MRVCRTTVSTLANAAINTSRPDRWTVSAPTLSPNTGPSSATIDGLLAVLARYAARSAAVGYSPT